MALQHDGLSRPIASPKLRVLSLGAGVQSTTLALMAARGEIEAPDCAIFADTGDELAAVYEHLAWLMSPGVLPFAVHVAKCNRTLKAALMAGDEDGARIPWHVGAGGMACAPSRSTRTGGHIMSPSDKRMRDWVLGSVLWIGIGPVVLWAFRG